MLRPNDCPNSGSWRLELKSAIRKPRELGEFLELPDEMVRAAEKVTAKGFPFLVPWSFAQRMERANPKDPLLLQVWPHADELTGQEIQSFVDDPVGDRHAIVASGLLHKYAERVLLVTTGACAVHCRYCFRQNFPYSDVPHSVSHWEPAFDYIESDASIHEVILSGGDPLTLRDEVLHQLVQRIGAIKHVQRLRIHSRLPIVIPSRIDESFLQVLSSSCMSKWFVLHCNHANEINEEVIASIKSLHLAGCIVLNQCVLSKGINDDLESQYALCESLVNAGVLPYYMHQLDRVHGAQRFEVDERVGIQLEEELRHRLPGYAVPKYVREVAGASSKTPIR